MTEYFEFLLRCSAISALLYVYYIFVIARDRNFRINRFYLLGIIILSFLIPLTGLLLPVGNRFMVVNALPEFSFDWFPDNSAGNPESTQEKIHIITIITIVYWSVCLLMVLRAVYFVYIVTVLIRRRNCSKDKGCYLIRTNNQAPFSFFRFLFVDWKKYKPFELNQIIAHEKVHIRELHSLDIILVEIFSVLLWFNPFVFFLKNAIKANHEFLADNYLIRQGYNPIAYQKLLVNEAVQNQPIGFVSYFNSLTIKKRIEMIANNKTRRLKKYKLFLMLPLIGLLISISGFKNNTAIIENPISAKNAILYENANPPEILPIEKAKIEKITVEFGRVFKNPVTKKTVTHSGVDIKAPLGTPVIAAANGVVREAKTDKGYGKKVVIQHDNQYTTLYAHLNDFAVKVNENVKKGQVIGRVGNTGFSTAPHLHYEVIKNGKRVNPADYYKF